MIVAVTGVMRSGTSLLSKMLHEMGIPMGTVMHFPRPGAYLEWEDVVFTETLAKGLVVEDFDAEAFFRFYLASRKEESFGVKSPFLLPYLTTFRSVCRDLGHEVKVILTKRDPEDVMQSLYRQTRDHDPMIARSIAGLQAILMDYRLREPESDLVVALGEMLQQPGRVESRVRKLVEREV